MDVQLILLIIGLILALIMSINLGGNDAANPTSPAIGAGIINIRRALSLFAVFTVVGAVLQGHMVMKTIGRGIIPEIDVLGAISIIIAANIWILIATLRGMAISTTHAIISGVIGYGILKFSIYGINVGVLGTIGLSWITSPLCSLALSYLLYRWLISFIDKSRSDPKKVGQYLKYILIGSLCFGAYSFGANDVANATGVYITFASKFGNIPDLTTMVYLALFGAFGMVIGGFLIGTKVVETLAFKVTHLNLYSALAASLSNAIVVYAFTTLPFIIFGYGLPISTSYASVGSIIGAGLAQNMHAVSKTVILRLIAFWMLTIPIVALLAMGIHIGLSFVIQL